MIRFFTLFTTSLILLGCSLFGAEKQPQLVLNVKAASNINSNLDGIPTPLEVRIYQLTDSQAFSQAEFIQIYNDEQAVLKAELIFSRRLGSLFPGEHRQEMIPIAAGTLYIGFIAGFADYQNAKNKVIYAPITGKSSIVNIEIDGINMSVSVSTQGNPQ